MVGINERLELDCLLQETQLCQSLELDVRKLRVAIVPCGVATGGYDEPY